MYLTEKKALSVKTKPENIVIGADQVLIHNGKIYNKPRSINEAKKHLSQLSDRTHNLVSGTVISKNNKIIWRGTTDKVEIDNRRTARDVRKYVDEIFKQFP